MTHFRSAYRRERDNARKILELWRLDFALCVESFRIGRISEAGFRHHLARLGYLAHEIEAEVAHHRTDREAT